MKFIKSMIAGLINNQSIKDKPGFPARKRINYQVPIPPTNQTKINAD